MKGIIFNEFLTYIENSYSYDLVDKILLSCKSESEGAYTAIGTYDSQEFFDLATALSKELHKSQKEILIGYGAYLFSVLVQRYSYFFHKNVSTFDFISKFETHGHFEVKKFYEDSDLPYYQCSTPEESKLVLTYTSSPPFSDFAEGLIKGCIEYHHEQIDIAREDFSENKGDKSKFILTKKDS